MMHKKEKEEFEDAFVKDFIEKGSRTISNENFESQVMQHIYSAAVHKKEVKSKLKWSMYFYYFAIALIGIYTLTTLLIKSTFNTSMAILTLFFTIVFGIVMLGNFKKIVQASPSEIDMGNL